MKRRTFIASAVSVLAAPLAAEAQPPSKVPRVGVMVGGAPTLLAGFRQGLRELGYTEGHSILIESRSAEGALDRSPQLVGELLRSTSTC